MAVRVYFEYFGDSIEIPAGETVIGRDVGCVLRFNDAAVSRRHLRFARQVDSVLIEDLGSSNGTLLNGQAIHARTQVHDGDVIMLGSRELTIRMVEADLGTPGEPATLALDDRLPPAALEQLGRVAHAHRRATVPPPIGPADGVPHKVNRRRHDRQAVELPLVYVSTELEIEATTRDLSESGVFVCSQVLDPIGTMCQLTILVDGGPPVRVAGIVRRVVQHPTANDAIGLGVEFRGLGGRELRWLQAVVAREPASSERTERLERVRTSPPKPQS